MMKRIVTLLACTVGLFLLFAPSQAAAQQGCYTCFEGDCLTGSGVGVASCDDIGGACLVGGDCCVPGVPGGCEGPNPPRQTLLDGTRSPMDPAGNTWPVSPLTDLKVPGIVFARLCQGDVVERAYGADRQRAIRAITRKLEI